MVSPIVTEWHDSHKTIVRQTFYPGWTVTDFLDAMRTKTLMTMNSQYIVSSITLVEGILVLPKGFIATIPAVLNNIPANEGLTVVVRGGNLIRVLFRLADTLAPFHTRRHYIVQTIAEAEDIIHREFGDVLASTP